MYVFSLRSELIIIGLQQAQEVIAIIKCECEIFPLNDSPPKEDLELFCPFLKRWIQEIFTYLDYIYKYKFIYIYLYLYYILFFRESTY